MRSDVAEHCLRHGDTCRPTQHRVRLANGLEASLAGDLRSAARVGHQKLTHRYAILPALTHPVILGMDALKKLRVRMTLGHQLLVPEAATLETADGVTACTPAQAETLQQLLDEELPKFQTLRGTTQLAEHTIRLKSTVPLKQRYTPRNPAMQQIINEEVNKMLAEGIIEPSQSPWSSPVVLVRKKNGKRRFCIDFRRVNMVTEKDAYPLPQVEATLSKLREARFISSIDLANGYWQVPLAPESRPITAFTVPGRGLYQFRVMPFGLHSAPATFQRLLDQVIGPELEPRAFAYLDDIIVLGRTFEEHLQNLRVVLHRLQAANLRINPEKCDFCRTELKYLGHMVTAQGIKTDPDKVQAILSIPAPTNLRELRRFLGMVSWYRRFITHFADTTAPLTKLLQKKRKWTWGPEEDAAFHALQHQLAAAPVLTCPDFTQPFTLQTDASDEGLGVVLTQEDAQGEHVIAYASRTLNPAERNYSTTEKECLAVVWGIRKMRPYLEGYHFTIITDHQALKWLQNIEDPSGRLARWSLELQQYDFTIKYRKGANNLVADALSRQPDEIHTVDDPPACTWFTRLKARVQQEPEKHPEYRLAEGRLYRRFPDYTGRPTEQTTEWKLCVPRPQRAIVLAENHDAPTAGHLGTTKTAARLAERYYWPGMFREAAKYVRQCITCQQYKIQQQAPAGQMHTTPALQPWEVVSADLVGPLPRSNKGHTTLCVFQDKFTKWVEVQPLRQATAPAVTRALKDLIFLRHGCPRVVITDNGRQFESREFGNLLKDAGSEHRKTPPYSPQCNPVERVNRVLKTMIAQYTTENHRHWDRWIHELAFAYNTAKHESTGFTPAFLTYGRELSPPATQYHPPDAVPPDLDNTDTRCRRQQIEHFQDTLTLARRNQARASESQRKHFNLRHRDWRPTIGTEVMRREHHLSDAAQGFTAKLAPKFAGPYRVHQFQGPNIVILKDSQNRSSRAHVKDLKPYNENNVNSEPPARGQPDEPGNNIDESPADETNEESPQSSNGRHTRGTPAGARQSTTPAKVPGALWGVLGRGLTPANQPPSTVLATNTGQGHPTTGEDAVASPPTATVPAEAVHEQGETATAQGPAPDSENTTADRPAGHASTPSEKAADRPMDGAPRRVGSNAGARTSRPTSHPRDRPHGQETKAPDHQTRTGGPTQGGGADGHLKRAGSRGTPNPGRQARGPDIDIPRRHHTRAFVRSREGHATRGTDGRPGLDSRRPRASPRRTAFPRTPGRAYDPAAPRLPDPD